MQTHTSLPIVLAVAGHAFLTQEFIVAGWITIGLAAIASIAIIVLEEWQS